MLAKRKLSLYLVLVMLFNLVVPFGQPVPVQAASALLVWGNQAIPESNTGFLPPVTPGMPWLTRPGAVLTQWNLNTGAPFTRPNEMYELSYFFDDDMEAVLTVIRREMTIKNPCECGDGCPCEDLPASDPDRCGDPDCFTENLGGYVEVNFDIYRDGRNVLLDSSQFYNINAGLQNAGWVNTIQLFNTQLAFSDINAHNGVSQLPRVNNFHRVNNADVGGFYHDRVDIFDVQVDPAVTRPAPQRVNNHRSPSHLPDINHRWLAPSFNIPLNVASGFSFIYHRQDIIKSFWFDPSTNLFSFSISPANANATAFREGRLYDFRLARSMEQEGNQVFVNINNPQLNTPPFDTNTVHFTGIDTNTIVVLPVADANEDYGRTIWLPDQIGNEPDFTGPPGGTAPDWTSWAEEDPPRPYRVEAIDVDGESAVDDFPGREDRRLSIRFDTPAMYDRELGQFVNIDALNDPPEGLVLGIDFNFIAAPETVSGGVSFRLNVRDLFSVGEIGSGNNLDNNISVESADAGIALVDHRLGWLNGNRILLTVGGLTQSTYYSEVLLDQNAWYRGVPLTPIPTINIANNSNIFVMYTFPQYSVILDRGRLFVQVEPFGVPGVYRLFRVSPVIIGEDAFVPPFRQSVLANLVGSTFHTGGDRLVEFTIPDTGDMIYFISFEPRDTPVAPGAPIQNSPYVVAFSQSIRYRPIIISTPSPPDDFIVHGPQHPITRSPVELHYRQFVERHDSEGREGFVQFYMQWNLGHSTTMADIFRNANEVTVRYEIQQSYAPTLTTAPPGLERPFEEAFDFINLTVTSSGGLVIESIANETTGVEITSAELLPAPLDRDGAYTYSVLVGFEADAGFDGIWRHQKPLWYPMIWHFRMQSHWYSVDGVERNHNYTSTYDFMVLDDLTVSREVPPPQISDFIAPGWDNEEALDEYPSVAGRMEIPSGAIREYRRYFYPDHFPHPEVEFNLYFGQDEDRITDTFFPTGVTMEEREAAVALTIRYDQNIHRPVPGSAVSPGAIIIDLDIPETIAPHSRDAVITALRTGGVVSLRGIYPTSHERNVIFGLNNVTAGAVPPIPFAFRGLDYNQEYFVFADSTMEEYYDFSQGLEIIPDPGRLSPPVPYYFVEHSTLSNLAGALTVNIRPQPDDRDEIPTAPVMLRNEVGIDGLGSAAVIWQAIPARFEGESIEYEIIRLEDITMAQLMGDPLVLNTREPLNDYLTQLHAAGAVGLGAWQTEETTLRIFNPSGLSNVGSHGQIVTSDRTPAPLVRAGTEVQKTDRGLSPNTLFYYYVRTVRITEDGSRIVSAWSHTTLTTEVVSGPQRLMVESGNPLFYNRYDPYTEVIISFDSPVELALIQAGEFLLQYQIRDEEGEWGNPQLLPLSQFIRETESTHPGYRRFYFRLTGFEPNTFYAVRVRLRDVTNADYSLWSNTVQFRTETDEEEYDERRREDSWMNYLRRLLEERLRNPFWTAREQRIRDDVVEVTLVYRQQMFNDLIAPTFDGFLTLHTLGGTARSNIFYLPIDTVRQAMEANRAIRFAFEDGDVVLPAGFIDTTFNEAIIDMRNYQDRRQINDYFIRVNINRMATPNIQGEETLTAVYDVALQAVGSSRNLRAWDNELFDYFTRMLEERLEDPTIREAIGDRVRDPDNLSQDMIDYIERIVRDFERDMHRHVASEMRVGNVVTRHNRNFPRVDRSLLLSVRETEYDAVVNGFMQTPTGWLQQPVLDHGDGRAMQMALAGRYAFTGRILMLPGVAEAPGGGTMRGIIARYGLDDFLGREGTFNMDAAATRHMVAGSVARMAGAPRGADPLQWMSANMNIQLSSRNAQGMVENQEAIAMLMALYERRTGTSVATMQIRNFNATAHLSLDDRYRRSVQAAVEMGLVAGQFQPDAPISVRTLLDMLTAMDARIGLR